MSDFTPTHAQALAIACRDSAVLVSAGAGSGKTRVLTERLLARLRDAEAPVDIDRFLIITYTRAAAAELRGRILEELSEALAADPGNRRLRRQNALLRRAQIGTIHGFCAALLRENSHLAGLSPDFKIADADRAEAMRLSALERALEDSYEHAADYPGFLELADTVGAGRDDKRLGELVLSLHSKMQCHAWPALWAEKQKALLREPVSDVGETPWGKELLARAADSAAYWSGELERCLCAMQAQEKLAAANTDAFAEAAEQIRALSRALGQGWEAARACLPIGFPRRKTVRNSPDPALSDWLKNRWDSCKDAMKALAASLEGDSAQLLADLRATEPAMSALLDLTLRFDARFSRDKQRAGLVDYSDLEHKAAQLLIQPDGTPTALARQVSDRYAEVMVDEYQDVSQVQDTIFRAVSDEGRRLFLVGDVKQSIYRFRLADPSLFTDKFDHFRDADSAAPGEARRILLQENFRSRREILNAANAVFSLCMSRAVGEIDYDENAALKYGATGYQGETAKPELLLLRLPGHDAEEERPDKTALEARLAARAIRRLLDAETTVTDHGQQRPLRSGDIAILLRSPGKVGAVYRRALAQEGIPVTGGQSGDYFSSVEVSTVLSLLAVVDNPHQDIPLLAVLRSPAFCFSADELSRIRAGKRDGDLYTALCAAAETDARCRSFLDWLAKLRRQAPDRSAGELLWRLMEELDLLALCSAMSDGERRRARLMALIGLAERFEGSGTRGLHRFVLWLRQLAARGQEPALGAESASAVQILSIHQSKGLEFPVVFLCDTDRRFNKTDLRENVLVHPELGLGPKRIDLERRAEYPTLARRAVAARLNRELLSEEMRLLYVALTRAKERLFITAATAEPEKRLDRLRAGLSVPLAPEMLLDANAMADWLLGAALADEGKTLRLTLCETEEAQAPEEAEAPRGAAEAGAEPELERLLGFVYPHEAATRLPSKLTATGLKGRREADEEAAELAPRRRRPFRMPDFARQNRPLSGAEKGTATHLVLQYMDFAQSGSLAAVQGEIERLRAAGFLSEREAQAVDAAAILRLFASPLGQRIKNAPALRREFRFSLLCDAGTVFAEGAGENLLLQGVVDCYLDAPEGLTVIDYKTDRLRSRAEAEERAALYRPQLAAYAGALERITGRPVRECVLYFLSCGEAVTLARESYSQLTEPSASS